MFRSPETLDILAAYERSEEEGFKAFREAYARSGIDPPDLDDFSWGEVMGLEEVAAQSQVERVLEQAIVSGRLVPGKSGWKGVARAITAEVLDSPHPGVPTQRLRDLILTERLEDWVRRAEVRGAELHRLRSAHANRLLHAMPIPLDAAERLAPISWFLDHAADGIRLTAAGYLPTVMVGEGWERFGWGRQWYEQAPRSERELVELHEVHHLLRRLGAVRRRGSQLRISALGRRMNQDVELAWRTVAAGLVRDSWPRAVAEAMTLLLLDGLRLDQVLEERAAIMLAEAGWRSDGLAPDPRMVMSAWYETWRPLRVLGGSERSGDWLETDTVLSSFGEATLIERLRVEATGPRTWRW